MDSPHSRPTLVLFHLVFNKNSMIGSISLLGIVTGCAGCGYCGRRRRRKKTEFNLLKPVKGLERHFGKLCVGPLRYTLLWNGPREDTQRKGKESMGA